ncbi:bis(5'-nucleosyl)-tetraphosphatase (symmetrical) ApaH [Candidatus Pantoea carbekii]|uniref:Bis(5'-nucleosyl)-tetraphosphatase, symmetrical n=1 Tax=Candidatus Pantoea carbekii TaxID=1235990 RepID=U3U6A1_9GAMM|nr:bis(5'-nucleosyl)-tetraphosphatase (symmetrical) ApaH [Candidatus Pantoea carbekii]AKC31948.1 Bis(5-nucleosyl)-tetraphosphatase ApaH [Candidatus Pantoea carbekii]BAO00465.1 ApaH protein [Candidatus Pantoea carbekii]
MNTYLIGDVHGCYNELCSLLKKVAFNPYQDELWLTGDLVARGPNSLDVLRYVKSLGRCVRMVLGNHDLHLIAVYAGISPNKPKDRLTSLLNENNVVELIDWLRCQPLLQIDEKKKLLMSHAGITPQWDLKTVKMCASQVSAILSSDNYHLLLNCMYGDMPNNWTSNLTGLARLRFSINALTKMRFCFPNGQLDMICKKDPHSAPTPLQPWFLIPSKIDREYTMVFGHWASLAGKGTPDKIIGLDTGCCWGGMLTLLHWETQQYYVQKSIY